MWSGVTQNWPCLPKENTLWLWYWFFLTLVCLPSFISPIPVCFRLGHSAKSQEGGHLFWEFSKTPWRSVCPAVTLCCHSQYLFKQSKFVLSLGCQCLSLPAHFPCTSKTSSWRLNQFMPLTCSRTTDASWMVLEIRWFIRSKDHPCWTGSMGVPTTPLYLW